MRLGMRIWHILLYLLPPSNLKPHHQFCQLQPQEEDVLSPDLNFVEVK